MQLREFYQLLQKSFNNENDANEKFTINTFVTNQCNQASGIKNREIFYTLYDYFKEEQSDDEWAKLFADILPPEDTLFDKDLFFIKKFDQYLINSYFYRDMLDYLSNGLVDGTTNSELTKMSQLRVHDYYIKSMASLPYFSAELRKTKKSSSYYDNEEMNFENLLDIVAWQYKGLSKKLNDPLFVKTKTIVLNIDEIYDFMTNATHAAIFKPSIEEIIKKSLFYAGNRKSGYGYQSLNNDITIKSIGKMILKMLENPIDSVKYKSMLNKVGIDYDTIFYSEVSLFKHAIKTFKSPIINHILDPLRTQDLKFNKTDLFEEITKITSYKAGIAAKIATFFINKTEEAGFESANLIAQFFDKEIKKHMQYREKNNPSKEFFGMENIIKYTQKFLKNQVKIKIISEEFEKASIVQSADELEKTLISNKSTRKFKL